MVQTGDELRVTVDTNLLDSSGLQSLSAAVKDLPIDIAIMTVSERESGRPVAEFHIFEEGAVCGESVWSRTVWTGPIHETLVLDESRLGEAVLGSDPTAELMDRILAIITDGSFPKSGERDELTDGQQRQLRDAMILEAHTRHRRDIFVTGDERGFIRNGRRDKLEQLCPTRILTPNEFADFCRERMKDP